MTDLTTIPTNPAYDLHAGYQHLMSLDDPAQLQTAAVQIVEYRLRTGGISKGNARKFVHTASNLGNDLDRLRHYVTNFMLKAAGLGVI